MINRIKAELRTICNVDDDVKIDLLEKAKLNNDQIAELFKITQEEIRKSSKEKSYYVLLELLEGWGLSVNKGWRKVLWTCKNKRIATTYEIALTYSEEKGIDYASALKEICKLHYDLRLIFNKKIRNEELFKYTAVNIGNLGLQNFGEFCFCINNLTSKNLINLALIKGNSLDSYSDADFSLDFDRLLKDISSIEMIKELISIKHKYEIINETNKIDWPNKICNNNCYIEAVVLDELDIKKINCVKIDSNYNSQFNKVAFRLKYGEDVSTIEADMLSNYISAKKELESTGINIEIV